MVGPHARVPGQEAPDLRDQDGLHRHPDPGPPDPDLHGHRGVTDAGRAGPSNPGAHGFSEILYAFASMTNNNGSAFAGLNGNTFYDLLGAAAIWFGRFWIKIPVLALAGSLAKKKIVPESAGTLPTHTPLFIVMLISTVLIVGALVFFPAMALGPIVEHLKMMACNQTGKEAACFQSKRK